MLVIGGGTHEEDNLFRVRGALLLDGGGVVVANGGSHQLLYFALDGTVQRRVGGQGQGPEEFGNLLWVQRGEGNEILAYDAGNLRMKRFDEAGTAVSTQALRFEAESAPTDRALMGQGFPIGGSLDGRVIAVPWAVAGFTGSEGLLPVRGELRNYVADLSSFTMIDTVTIRTWYEVSNGEGPPMEQILEAPAFIFGASRDRIAYSDASGHRVSVLESGAPLHIVVEERTRIPFLPDSLPASVSVAADSLPAYRALRVDSEGRIWLKPSHDAAAEEVEWRVVSKDGKMIDTAVLPTSALLLDALGDRALFLERDEFGVETVVIRRIHGVAF